MGSGTDIILIVALLCGSILCQVFPQAGTMLSGSIDFTVLLLVFCLLFEVRFANIFNSLNRLDFMTAALVANFVIIPALGCTVASVFLSGQPLFFIGLMIYFMMPCTDWFLAFTGLGIGNTILGAALLPLNLIVQILLYPIYLHLLGVDAAPIDIKEIFKILSQWFLASGFLPLSYWQSFHATA